MCFGGVIRDMMCQREARIGMDSYAFATGVGASTFVALRQLVLHGWQLPLGFRMTATASTVLYLRWLAWESKGERVDLPDHLLSPWTLHRDTKNRAAVDLDDDGSYQDGDEWRPQREQARSVDDGYIK
eukprot:CAMPEP_0205912566 /NCGR_PEP_ID=MMETSP1325-20131115/5931_1 /ASSEMBLY_ACC=CAM_ASM_000708 /TAXON_ID=236786 /ORGANISM="Florenciella sp., Strain RCC1007" /LENGTH=127 /DNA_ID=CAMNT_0053279287 /DNA_START=54 /DNA_END=434 /DNA_ORIENTATION=-